MAVSDPALYRDRTADFMDMWHRKRSDQVRVLVTETLIAEHQGDPVGDVAPHSGELTQVLNYLRMAPTPGKDFAYMSQPFTEYRIGLISPRGEQVTYPDDDRTFSTENDAVQAIFLRRLRRMGLLDSEVQS